MVTKIGTGFANFVVLPAQGFEQGPAELGKGVFKGTGSLIKNTF
jgi:hypothetical protein